MLCLAAESLVPGGFGVPLHLHIKQDEWFRVLSVGGERFRLAPCTSLFCPRKIPHRWKSVVDSVSRLLMLAQPAGRLEEFFERFAQFTPDQVRDVGQISAFFAECEMEVVGPPLEDSVRGTEKALTPKLRGSLPCHRQCRNSPNLG